MKWILFSLLCFAKQFVLSQIAEEINVNVVNFKTKNGLPNSNIEFTFQDVNGYIWIGTRGGLSRFDGYDFYNFYPNPAKRNYFAVGHFTSYLKTSDSTYLIGTLGDGLFQLNCFSNQLKKIPNTPKSITCLFLQNKNSLWIGTLANGFYNYSLKNKRKQQYLLKPLVHAFSTDWDNNTVNAIGMDPKYPTRLWLGCRSGLHFMDFGTKVIKSFFNKNTNTVMHQYAENAIECMYFDKNGAIWTGHFFGGLAKFDIKTEKWKRYLYNPKDFSQKVLRDNIVLDIALFNQHFFLLSTSSGPIEFDLKNEVFKKYILIGNNEVQKGDVVNLMLDSKKNIWVSQIYQQGLSLVSKSFNVIDAIKFPKQNFKPDYYGSCITDLFFSEKQDRYFMTISNHDGLVEYDQNFRQLNTYEVPSYWLDKEPFPTSIAEDEKGTIWINDITGKLMTLKSKSKSIQPATDLPFDCCSKLVRCNGVFFIAQTEKGAFTYSKTGWRKILPKVEVLPKDCLGKELCFISNRKLYTYNLETKKTKFLVALSSFCFENNNYIHEIFKDSKNRIWIPLEYGGVYRFNVTTKKMEFFNSKDGLASNSVRRAIEDGSNRIFLLCQGGFYFFDESLNRFVDFDGLVPSTSISWDETSLALTKKGELMLSKDNAAQKISQAEIFNYSNLPPLISTITANKVHYFLTDTEFIVPNYQNALQIFLTNFDYAHKNEILFEFQLNNSNELWKRLPKGINKIELTNLREGKYQLNYRIAGQTKSKVLFFTIETVWYKSQRFYKSLTGFFILIGSGFLVYFLKKRKKERHLERKVTEFKLKALQAQLNPHFLFNCLTSISGLVKMGEYDRAETTLHDFAKLMRKILLLSERESISLVDEMELSKLYLNIEKVRKDELFSYCIRYDESLSEFQLPPMTLQPFLENCVKHAFIEKDDENKGEIEVDIYEENGNLNIEISDNGVGFQLVELPKMQSHQSKGLKLQEERLKEYFLMMNKVVELNLGRNSEGGTLVRIQIKNRKK